MAIFIPSTTTLLAASVQSRQRMRAANRGTDKEEHRKTWKEINEERQKREKMLTPEEFARYKQALEDFERDPGYPENMKDGSLLSRFYLREKDAIIGAFLGSDIREYPDYQSDRVRKIRESMLTPEELAKYKQALEDFEKNPGYPEWMKDGLDLAHFYLREKDALICSFLGSDLRKYPDYQSNRYPNQVDKSGIKKR